MKLVRSSSLRRNVFMAFSGKWMRRHMCPLLDAAPPQWAAEEGKQMIAVHRLHARHDDAKDHPVEIFRDKARRRHQAKQDGMFPNAFEQNIQRICCANRGLSPPARRAMQHGLTQPFGMPAVVDRMAGEVARWAFNRRLAQQMPDVVAAMDRFEQRLLPCLASHLAAGRAGAEAVPFAVLTLNSDDCDMRTERRLDT